MIESGYYFNAIKRDLSMVKGDTMSFAFQIKGLDNQTPEEVLFTCKERIEDTSTLFQVSLENTIDIRSYDAESDTFTFSVRIPPYKTSGLSLGRYFYDLEMQVNGDTITLMSGRLSLEYEVTTGTSPEPHYSEGDDVLYPVANIPAGEKKIYLEQRISDIATAIIEINGSSSSYTTLDMPAAIAGIGDTIEDLQSTITDLQAEIAELESEIPPEIDNVSFPSII